MSIAIKVENVSKAYRLGVIGTGTLGNDIKRWYARTRGKEDPFLKIGEANDRTVKGESDVVWSLKDINFEIEQGEAVGIIGRNGAGKSTLLKILSRVTAPTTGRIIGNGRVASLLEVGTGFHPELTGKENIYLNGAILGMRKKEITRKFEEIVDFAGVERYIDTPVKRYSSGMYVRLAFAVAAYLESEILIVDEVLAVGDAEFQKKCLGKMNEVSKGEGRTVLFVSHNMTSIMNLCKKTIYLENGLIKDKGHTQQVISHYLSNESVQKHFKKDIEEIKSIQLIEAELDNVNHKSVQLRLILFSRKQGNVSIDLRIKDGLTTPFGFYSFGALNPTHLLNVHEGENIFLFSISTAHFAAGAYWISVDITNPSIEYYDRNEDILFFEVVKSKGQIDEKQLEQSWNYGSMILPVELIR
jgi:lipopolysaccharide transport system ATP-binding protein